MDEGRAPAVPARGRRPVASLAGQREAGPGAVIGGWWRRLPGVAAVLPVYQPRDVGLGAYQAGESSSVRPVRSIREADAASRHFL
jgi:hypothetical protein